MRRRSAPVYLAASGLDYAAQAPGPQQPLVAATSSVVDFVNSIIGNSHKFGGTTYEGAEQARADAGAIGAAGGSVQAARYLLAQQKTDTSAYAQSATKAAIVQATAANPAVMQQAMATPLTDADHDQADGTNVLGILWQLKLPLADAYAGYSTSTGGPGSGTAMQLAQQLRALPPLASGALPGAGSIATSSPMTSPMPGTAPALMTAGSTLPLANIQNIAQQIASGALNVSALATLGSQDIALIQQQVAAIKAGNIPPGGFSVFLTQNKPLLYTAGAALLIGTVAVVALRPRRRRA